MTDFATLAERPVREIRPEDARRVDDQRLKNYETFMDREDQNEREGRFRDISEQNGWSRDVIAQLARLGIQPEDLRFTYSRETARAMDRNQEMEQKLKDAKTFREVQEKGLADLRQVLTRIERGKNAYGPDSKANIYSDVSTVAVRLQTVADSMRKVLNALEGKVDDRQQAQYASQFLDAFGSTMDLSRLDPQTRQAIEAYKSSGDPRAQRMVQEILKDQLAQITEDLEAQLKDIRKKLLVVNLDSANKDQYYADAKQAMQNLTQTEIGGLQFINPDPQGNSMEQLVFDNWTVNRADWFDEQNPKNMETAIILTERFEANEKYKVGHSHALYNVEKDGQIKVNLENVYLLILDRLQYHMWFQDPDDPIDPLQYIRMFETPFRSASLFEFLVYDAPKYAQSRTPDGQRKNPNYENFLLYMALHISSTSHNFNSGIEAKNSMSDEQMWQEYFKKLCRSNKLANSKRLFRLLKTLSVQEMKRMIDQEKGIGELLGYDGTIGKAMSDVATMHKYIFELSGGSWNVRDHVSSTQAEAAYERQYRAQIIRIKQVLGNRMDAKAGDTIIVDNKAYKKSDLENAVRAYDKRIAEFQNGENGSKKQNIFFKTLGSEENIRAFLAHLTNKYLLEELKVDPDPRIKSMLSKYAEKGIMPLDLLISTQKWGKDIDPSDVQLLMENLTRRGAFWDKKANGGRGAIRNQFKDALDKVKQGGDEGEFFRAIFNLEGNHYKQKDLNPYTQYGVFAKGPLMDVLNETTQDFIQHVKYKGQLEEEEAKYVMESATKTPHWLMVAMQNDTGVSGNTWYNRVAHPGEYLKKNQTNLNVGLKETMDIIRNSPDMWNGIAVTVTVRDKATGQQWHEAMWLGEYFERNMHSQREELLDPQFAEGAMTVFYTRRVDAMMKMFKNQRDVKTSGTFNPGDLITGYLVNGSPFVDLAGEEAFFAQRNVLNDFLYASKFPLLYHRMIREWEANDDGSIAIKTIETERHMLGDNVFLMEEPMMQNAEVRKAIESGTWDRGKLLEAMTELAFIGGTVRTHFYDYLPRSERDKYTEYQMPLALSFIHDLEFILTKSKLTRTGVDTIRDPKTGRVEYRYKGERFNEETVAAMFKYIVGVPIGRVRLREIKDNTQMTVLGLLMTFIEAVVGEFGKSLKDQLK